MSVQPDRPRSPPSRPLRILFACIGNAGRSQIAQAWAERLGGSRVEARSGGSKPASGIMPEALAALRERGMDIEGRRPKGFDERWVREECDLVVTMGCGDDACPAFIGKPLVDWELPDPKGRDLDFVRALRDDIERRVRELLHLRGVLAQDETEKDG